MNRIKSLPEDGLKRLCLQAEVTRMSPLLFEEMTGWIRVFLEKIFRNATNPKKGGEQVMVADIEAALPITAYSDHMLVQACRTAKGCDGLNIPPQAFQGFALEIFRDYGGFRGGTTITPNAFALLQYATENFMVSLLKSAKILATHAGRETVEPKDINTALIVSGKRDLVGEKVSPPPFIRVIDLRSTVQKLYKELKGDTKQTLSSDTASQLSFFANQVLKKVAMELATISQGPEVTQKDVEHVVRRVLPGELAKHAYSNGLRGLKFPEIHAQMHTMLAQVKQILSVICDRKISEDALKFLAYVNDYLLFELLEITDSTQNGVGLRQLRRAVARDEEFKILFLTLGIMFIGAGYD